jgi:hypothetical protein
VHLRGFILKYLKGFQIKHKMNWNFILRNLTRQQESIAEISAKTKLQLHSLIDLLKNVDKLLDGLL